MKLLGYLRRALAGLRLFVGGPVLWSELVSKSAKLLTLTHQFVFGSLHSLQKPQAQMEQSIIELFERLAALASMPLAIQDFIAVAWDKIHIASLAFRSSKRHGPFVLGLTGGNALWA